MDSEAIISQDNKMNTNNVSSTLTNQESLNKNPENNATISTNPTPAAPAVAAPKLTIEQEEEMKLRNKYPNRPKPSNFLQKILHKGEKRYFDSADYTMATDDAKIKHKAAIQRQQNTMAAAAAVAATSTPNNTNNNNNSNNNNISNTNNSNDAVFTSTPVMLGSSNNTSNNNNNNEKSLNSLSTSSESTPPSNVQQPLLDSINTNCSTPDCLLPATATTTTTIPHQSSVVNSSDNIENVGTHTTANLSPSACRVMPTSVSSTSITMSGSGSSDKLVNIHLNTTNPTSSLDVDEIGHGIPTPECLPQSRKHSIVQSKLATPRLSTSSS